MERGKPRMSVFFDSCLIRSTQTVRVVSGITVFKDSLVAVSFHFWLLPSFLSSPLAPCAPANFGPNIRPGRQKGKRKKKGKNENIFVQNFTKLRSSVLEVAPPEF